jgi:membrane associated rhomboid family serine protease
MFGKDLEMDWGKNKFLVFYFVCGMGAGFITVLFGINSIIPIVGASGAIYGLLVAYGFTYPNRTVYLYGVFPLKVKYVVLGFGVIAFVASLSITQSKVSHITHLAGMIIGIVYILFNFRWKNIRLWYTKIRLGSIQNKENSHEDEDAHIKMQVDKILDKLNDQGWESLTSKEEKFLTRASKRIFDDRPPN